MSDEPNRLANFTTLDLMTEIERRRPVHEPMEFLKIVTAVSLHYKIQCDNIRSWSRLRECVIPRHVAMYLCVNVGLGISSVGRFFDRDHTTILHAVKNVKRSHRLVAIASQIQRKL